MNDKICIGFEIGGPTGQQEQDIWSNKGDYRQVCRELELNGDNIMYLITITDDQTYANTVAEYLGIPNERVISVPDVNTLLTVLGQNEISIYLTNSEEVVNLGNTDTNKLANILVDFKPDASRLQGKWFSQLEFWLSRRLNNRTSE